MGLFILLINRRQSVLEKTWVILVSVAEVGILPIRLVTPFGLQSNISVVMGLAILLITPLVLYTAENIVCQTSSGHQGKCAKHRAYSEGIRGCLSIKEELRTDNIANGCKCQLEGKN